MTEEEQDQLASAYLDGEATPQEVALVERDSVLQARVASLRAVSTQLGNSIVISSDLKEQHLAAALAQFNPSQTLSTAATETGSSEVPADNVIDISNHRTESTPSISAQPTSIVRSRSMPQWLSAAAVTICVLGGGTWLASQMGSSSLSNDSFKSADASSSNDSDEPMEEMADADAMQDSAMQDSADDAADTIAESDAIEDDAMEDSSEDDADDELVLEEPSGAGSAAASTPGDTTNQSGFFPDEPVASFGDAPDAAELLDAPPAPPRIDLEQSQCVNEINRPVQVTGYLPIEVGGNPAEFIIFIDEDGNESGLVLDDECQPLG